MKNIIFDLGNTVIRFEPEKIARRFYDKDKDFEQLLTTVFDRKFWRRLDDGSISQEDFKKSVRAELPEYLHEYSDKFCDCWQSVLPVVDGMEKLLNELCEKGYRLFVLSNISKHFSEHREENPILEKFEGLIFSADEKLVKPDIKIFDLALERFGLVASETLFVDDLYSNIQGAEKAGIVGYVFDGDVARLHRYILEQKTDSCRIG